MFALTKRISKQSIKQWVHKKVCLCIRWIFKSLTQSNSREEAVFPLNLRYFSGQLHLEFEIHLIYCYFSLFFWYLRAKYTKIYGYIAEGSTCCAGQTIFAFQEIDQSAMSANYRMLTYHDRMVFSSELCRKSKYAHLMDKLD